MDGWQFLVSQPEGHAAWVGDHPWRILTSGTSTSHYGWIASKGQAAKGNPSGCTKTTCEGRSVSCLCWPNFHSLHDLKREMDLGSNDLGFLKLDQCWPKCSDFYPRAKRSNTWYPAVWNRDCTIHSPQLCLTEEFSFPWWEFEKGLCLVSFPIHSFLPFLGWETLFCPLWQSFGVYSGSTIHIWANDKEDDFFLLQHCMAYIHTRMRKKYMGL